ncbi:DNA topoisomerase (ATP-hydrolyzing) [Sporobolomyces salmoneus]|uniref:DNA topoisomerase (ATP-hydrolyzing) n=1 Tax=Sporobolomyces salmoneus TaxID=183962 RepID=UPI003177BF34
MDNILEPPHEISPKSGLCPPSSLLNSPRPLSPLPSTPELRRCSETDHEAILSGLDDSEWETSDEEETLELEIESTGSKVDQPLRDKDDLLSFGTDLDLGEEPSDDSIPAGLRRPLAPPFDPISALRSSGDPSFEEYVTPTTTTRKRSDGVGTEKNPTQEEMDAFFGFVDPSSKISSASPPPATPFREYRPPTPPASAPRKRRKLKKSSETIVLSPVEGSLPSASAEKRLAIISSLQRLLLDILRKLAESVRTLTGTGSLSTTDRRPALSSTTMIICVELTRRGGRPAAAGDDQSEGAGVELDSHPKKQRIVYPRKLGKGVDLRIGGRELGCFLRVVELVLEGLIDDTISTKRDLYYRDVFLFRKQQTVDKIIDDLAAALKVRRSELNVVATSKGLFAGELVLRMTDGTTKSGSGEGSLIPPALLIDRLEASQVAWILVVEKDAIFHSLASTIGHKGLGKGVLITGKGYPDVATRELVKRLADDFPSVPIMFLVDGDPHGIEIMSTFVLGSSAMSHDAFNLATGVERATWIGLRPTSLTGGSIPRDDLLLLTPRDRKKILAMIRREWIPSEWRRELECMLHLNRKAEIEILSSRNFPLSPPDSFEEGPLVPTSTRGSALVAFVSEEIKKVLVEKGDEG